MERITVGTGTAAREVAMLRRPGRTPGLLWLGGFRSDMTGTKAEALDGFAAARGLALTRFDWSGHGASGGAFEEGTISRWAEEAAAVFATTEGPQIPIGSSMGGWIALLLVRALRAAGLGHRLAGLVLVAPAADFTEDLMWASFPAEVRRRIETEGVWHRPSAYGDDPYPITRGLIEDGRRNLVLGGEIDVGCPVVILQGVLDDTVPWSHAVRLVTRLTRDDVTLSLIPDGDHRLSRPQDIDRLLKAVSDLVG